MKKLTALLTALTLCGASIISMNSGAIFTIANDNEAFEEKLADYTEVNDSGLFTSYQWLQNPNPSRPYKLYVNDLQTEFLHVETFANHFEFKVKEFTDFESAEIVIEEILNKYEMDFTTSFKSDWTFAVYDNTYSEEDYEQAVAICNELKEQDMISSFNYYTDELCPNTIYCTSVLKYPDEYKEMLESYVSDNKLDCEISDGDNCVYVVPNYEISYEEEFVLAKKIRDDLIILPCAGWNEIGIGPIGGKTIILHDESMVYGDINNNGEVDVSDAVSLLAYTTNSEIYVLSDEQLITADVYQQGDGVGINDAASIQKYLTKQIDSLPESTI